jgi:hypothetical protein
MKFMWGEGAKGLLIGAGLGALSGLSAGVWLLGDLLYVGVAILVGAVVCGVAGFLWGESFFEWLRDCWYWFF